MDEPTDDGDLGFLYSVAASLMPNEDDEPFVVHRARIRRRSERQILTDRGGFAFGYKKQHAPGQFAETEEGAVERALTQAEDAVKADRERLARAEAHRTALVAWAEQRSGRAS